MNSSQSEAVDRVAFELEGGLGGERAWKLKGDSHAAARAVMGTVEVEAERLRAIAAAANEVVADLCALAEEQPGNPHDPLSERLYVIARKVEEAQGRL